MGRSAEATRRSARGTKFEGFSTVTADPRTPRKPLLATRRAWFTREGSLVRSQPRPFTPSGGANPAWLSGPAVREVPCWARWCTPRCTPGTSTLGAPQSGAGTSLSRPGAQPRAGGTIRTSSSPPPPASPKSSVSATPPGRVPALCLRAVTTPKPSATSMEALLAADPNWREVKPAKGSTLWLEFGGGSLYEVLAELAANRGEKFSVLPSRTPSSFRSRRGSAARRRRRGKRSENSRDLVC
jgi:hypothetical protein